MHSTSPKDAPGDDQLIDAILAGATNDFEVLVVKYQDMIFAMIRRQVLDDATAKDLAQDTFLRAFQNLGRFRRESSFGTWLTRIALNITNSYFSSRRYKQHIQDVSFDPQKHGNIPDEPQNENSKSLTLRLLQYSIGTLKPKYRDVIVLCTLEGKTYEEAAQILGLPVGTVCSRMNKALTLLRNKFGSRRGEVIS